ncbi:MAG: Jag N-terminal domain-containing protein, partial [Gemmataceae bacterium]|nr:Jag N-terminal domain-containing protein [Gemmataceae bacterium]
MDQVETSGRTVDDALSAALRQLGCTIDDVEFTVLDEGRRGFLGRGSRDALVRVVRISPAPAGAASGQPAGGRPQRGPRPDRGPRPAGDGNGTRDRGGRGGRDRDRGP